MTARAHRSNYLPGISVLAGALLWAAPLPAQGASTCRPAGAGTAALIERLTMWITTTDPEQVQLRNTAYHVPVVPTSTLVVVGDKKVCDKAAKAYAAQLGTPVGPMYVVRMGSGSSVAYAVQDPVVGTEAGGMGAVLILDKQFRRIGGWSF